MRHQIIKQKQAIAHHTIQPLARLMSIRTEQAKEIQEISSLSEMDARGKGWRDDQNQNFMLRNTKRSKMEQTGTVAHHTIREKQWNIPSLDKRVSNRSQKLVAKQSVRTLQHTDRAVKPSISFQKIEQDRFRSQSKKEEHVQNLIKANQNLRNLQVKNNATLLRSIEILKNSERHYLPNIQVEKEVESIRKDDSLNMLETLQVTDLPEVIEEGLQMDDKRQKFLRSMKEEAAIRFKEKIKVKQSRRHIYRTLKSKNDALNKIKMKTHHCTPKKDHSNPEIRQIQELQLLRVHCPEAKKNSNNIRSSNFRSLTKTYYQNMRELRTQTKQGSLQGRPTFELRTTKCQFLSNDIQSLNQAYKKKSGMEAYEQIAMRLKKNQQIFPNNKQPKKSNSNNVFRELTPWRFEEQ